eukprot:111206-Alexandrium_andersonii.AAC.1
MTPSKAPPALGRSSRMQLRPAQRYRRGAGGHIKALEGCARPGCETAAAEAGSRSARAARLPQP